MDLTGLTEKRNRAGTRYYVDSDGSIRAKVCTKCSRTKREIEFSADRSKLGGRRGVCKECERKYRKDNKERIRRWRKKYREENKHEIRRDSRKYYEENIDMFREYMRKYYEENKDMYREYFREYREENKDKLQIHSQNRRAREAHLPNELTEGQYADILSKFKGGCALTGYTDNLHLDHVIPIVTGHGGTIFENIIPLRADLNNSKHARCIFDWFAEEKERFGLSQRKFDELIEYLADINDMTVEEYEAYVRWCHDNPRGLDEIKAKKDTQAS